MVLKVLVLVLQVIPLRKKVLIAANWPFHWSPIELFFVAILQKFTNELKMTLAVAMLLKLPWLRSKWADRTELTFM